MAEVGAAHSRARYRDEQPVQRPGRVGIEYLTALEQAKPLIEAIAVTDYYVTDTYEEVLRQKAAGFPTSSWSFPTLS